MRRLSRRHALGALAGGLGVALAGCTDDGSGGGNAEPTTDDPTTDDPTTTPGTGAVADTAVLQLGSSLTSDWFHDEERPGRVVAIDSEARGEAALAPASTDEDTPEAVTEFLSATDFERSVVVLVETVGPSTCYSEVAVEDVRLDGDDLLADARAVDTSEEGEACGDAITFAAALLRATVDGTPPTTATVTVTSGLGDSADLTASVEDPLAVGLDDLAGSVRPDDDPPTVPAALSCPDAGEFRRHPPGYEDVAWGAAEGEGEDAPTFGLRTDSLAAAYGDTVTITLTNVTASRQYTGNRHKYNLEVLTEAGWQDVRGTTTDRPFEYTDEALRHDPGEALGWEIELTEDGVVEGHYHEDRMTVCPDLPAGRYRFVLWEPTVAVAFDVER